MTDTLIPLSASRSERPLTEVRIKPPLLRALDRFARNAQTSRVVILRTALCYIVTRHTGNDLPECRDELLTFRRP